MIRTMAHTQTPESIAQRARDAARSLALSRFGAVACTKVAQLHDVGGEGGGILAMHLGAAETERLGGIVACITSQDVEAAVDVGRALIEADSIAA